MSVKSIAAKQSIHLLERTAERFVNLQKPNSGWIPTLRKALGLTGAQLARRLGVTRAAVGQAERSERSGSITIKQMEKIADAMDGRFVYAIIPRREVETTIREQARRKAKKIVLRAGTHMALEKQSLPASDIEWRINELTEELIKDRPSDFWED